MFAKQADGTLVVCGMHAKGDRVALPSLPKAPRQKAAAGKTGLIAKETPQKKRARAAQPAPGAVRPSRPQRVSQQSAAGTIWLGGLGVGAGIQSVACRPQNAVTFGPWCRSSSGRTWVGGELVGVGLQSRVRDTECCDTWAMVQVGWWHYLVGGWGGECWDPVQRAGQTVL